MNRRWNTISPFPKFGETETTIRVFNIPNLSSHELSNLHDNHKTMVQIVVTNSPFINSRLIGLSLNPLPNFSNFLALHTNYKFVDAFISNYRIIDHPFFSPILYIRVIFHSRILLPLVNFSFAANGAHVSHKVLKNDQGTNINY